MKFLDEFYRRPDYRPDVDGIRALAAIAILLYHAWPGRFDSFILSVDVFFVISGYLITSIIIRSMQKNSFGWWQFYHRRILRVFPPIILVLGLCLIGGYFLLTSEEYMRIARHARAAVMFGTNFSLMGEAGYFDVATSLKPLVHLWTLAIEEQFYLFYPPLLLLAAGISGKMFLIALLGGISLFFGAEISEWILGNGGVSRYYSPLPRAFDICAGALLALLVAKGVPPPRRAALFALAGVLLVVGACFFVGPQDPWPSLLTFVPVAGIALLIYAGPHNPVSKIILCNRPLVFIGLVSYELYLLHWPLLSFANILSGGPEHVDNWLKVLLLCAALLLAWLAFACIGLPLRHKYRHKSAMSVALLCMLVAVGLGAHYVARNDGLPARIAQAPPLKNWDAPEVKEDVARAAPFFPDWARFSDSPNQVAMQDLPQNLDVAIIGDSHSMNLYAGLAEKSNVKIGVFPSSGQAPFPQIATLTEHLSNYRSNGWQLIGQAYDMVLKNPNIKLVLLAHNPMCSIGDSIDPQNPDNQDPTILMENAMRQSLALLRKAGKKVLFVLDNPTLDFDPDVLNPRPLAFLNDRAARTVSRATAEAYPPRQWYNAICKKVAAEFDNVSFVDLFDAFCDGESCSSYKDGQLLYFDRSHLTVAGSRVAAPLLDRTIRNILDS